MRAPSASLSALDLERLCITDRRQPALMATTIIILTPARPTAITALTGSMVASSSAPDPGGASASGTEIASLIAAFIAASTVAAALIVAFVAASVARVSTAVDSMVKASTAVASMVVVVSMVVVGFMEAAAFTEAEGFTVAVAMEAAGTAKHAW
jgi:hypothetical protein